MYKKLKEYKYFDNIVFHLVTNILFALTVTLSSYIHIPLSGKGIVLYSGHLLLLQSTVAGFIYLLSLNKLIFKFVFSFLYLFLGGTSYWVYSLDISISPAIIEAIFQTETELIFDLLSIHFIVYLIIMIGCLKLILVFYNRLGTNKNNRSSLFFALILIAIFFVVEKKKPNTFKVKLPYQLFFSFYDYFTLDSLLLEDVSDLNFISNLKEPIQVTFVLGETVRADHLGVNGYYRNTTPNLSKIRKNFISYPNLYTNKQLTSQSIPQICTNQSIYDTTNTNLRSVYSILNNANIATSWIGNQHLESSYKAIAMSNDKVINIDQWKSSLSYNKAKDEALIPYLNNELKDYKHSSAMTTLHMVGSHWWYEKRYTDAFRKYTPVIDSKYLPSLSKESIINSYDNTILYLDFFLNETIKAHLSSPKPSVLIYVSDHGESLGEDGKWLHGHKSKYVANPGFIIWYSETFKEVYPDKVNYFETLRTSKLTTDVIYYLVLNLFGIED